MVDFTDLFKKEETKVDDTSKQDEGPKAPEPNVMVLIPMGQHIEQELAKVEATLEAQLDVALEQMNLIMDGRNESDLGLSDPYWAARNEVSRLHGLVAEARVRG